MVKRIPVSLFDFSQPKMRKLKHKVTSGVRKKLKDLLSHLPRPSLALAWLNINVFTLVIIKYLKMFLSVMGHIVPLPGELMC